MKNGGVFFLTHILIPASTFRESCKIFLTHFMPLISFDTPRKHQNTRGFLMFSWGIERDQWYEMG